MHEYYLLGWYKLVLAKNDNFKTPLKHNRMKLIKLAYLA